MILGATNPSTNEILKDQLYLGKYVLACGPENCVVLIIKSVSLSLAAAQCPEHRKKLGITHLVSVCCEYPSTNGTPNTHLHIPVEDTEYEDLLIHLPKTSRFIQEALEDGGRVLVHCVMGVSRSTTVVAAFRKSRIWPVRRFRIPTSYKS